jgi:hypothetical protein
LQSYPETVFFTQLLQGGAGKAFAAVSDDLRLIKGSRAMVSALLLGATSWSLNLRAINLLALGVGIERPVGACFFFGSRESRINIK